MKIVMLFASVASAVRLSPAGKALAQDKKSCAYLIRSQWSVRRIGPVFATIAEAIECQ